MSFFDEVGSKVNQGFNTVTSKTKDYTGQVKLDFEQKDVEREINAHFTVLGRMFYEAKRGKVQAADADAEPVSGEAAEAEANAGANAIVEPDYESVMVKIDELKAKAKEIQETKEKLKNKVVCPSCGKTVTGDAKFCGSCGALLEPAPAPAPVEAAPAPIAGKVCKTCGNPLEDDDLFCAVCGTKVESEQPKTEPVAEPEPEPEVILESVCKNCGNKLKEGQLFCGVCGTKVE